MGGSMRPTSTNNSHLLRPLDMALAGRVQIRRRRYPDHTQPRSTTITHSSNSTGTLPQGRSKCKLPVLSRQPALLKTTPSPISRDETVGHDRPYTNRTPRQPKGIHPHQPQQVAAHQTLPWEVVAAESPLATALAVTQSATE